MSTDSKPLTAFQQSYHWRNKNCGPWAHKWVKDNLPGLKVEDGTLAAELTEVTNVSGDCDLGQRKGKLLTIYDIEIEAKWKGTTKSGKEVTGRLSVPEFSHEAIDGLSDYVFTFSVDESSAEASELLAYVRKAFPPVISERFNAFRGELLNAHGIFTDAHITPGASGASTPVSVAARATESYSPAPPGEVRAKATPSPAPKPKEALTKTSTVEVTANLQASADDLWSLLTDQNRVPMWTRSAAKIQPVAGTEFELFGGNVTGKVESAEAPTKLVQSWNTRSPGWPADHFGTMTITLKQGSDSTTLTFNLAGVPSGKEQDIERALDAFYIRGLKQMGLVLDSSSRSYKETRRAAVKTATGTAAKKPQRKRKQETGAGAGSPGLLQRLATPQVVGGAAAVGLAAVFVGLVASTFARPA